MSELEILQQSQSANAIHRDGNWRLTDANRRVRSLLGAIGAFMLAMTAYVVLDVAGRLHMKLPKQDKFMQGHPHSTLRAIDSRLGARCSH